MANYLLRRRKLGKGSTRAIQQITEQTFLSTLDPNSIRNGDTVIRWGCTATIPAEAITVINKAEAIHRVNNKSEFRRDLHTGGVRIPFTVFTERDLRNELVNDEENVTWIARPSHHAQGRKIVTFNKYTPNGEVAAHINRLGYGWYASRLIPKDREFRIYIVRGRVVAVAEKIVEDTTKVAWNHALGSTFVNVRYSDWPLAACVEAVKAFNVSGLDFGGVDVIQQNSSPERGETPYVLEINSAPSLTSRYRQECFSKAFTWLIEGKEVPEVKLDRVRGWRRLVHPAISSECRDD